MKVTQIIMIQITFINQTQNNKTITIINLYQMKKIQKKGMILKINLNSLK